MPDNSDKSDYFTFIQPGDLIITDLGYFKTYNLRKIDELDAFYLSRLKLNTTIYVKDENGNYIEVNLLELASSIHDSIVEAEIYIKDGQDFQKVRLTIERVPSEVFEQRLRRINTNDKKKGKTTSEKTKELQAFGDH